MKIEIENCDLPLAYVLESVQAIAGWKSMRERGIDEAFAAQFAVNMRQYEKLPESAREKAAAQFAAIAYAINYKETVVRKHPEILVQTLAEWMKALNLLLVMNRLHAAIEH